MAAPTVDDPPTGPLVGGADPARGALIAEVAARVGSPREARWIVEHAESAPSDGGSPGSAAVAAAARSLAARRAGGEPLQYVLGRWPFRELELVVDRRVLIPRPETEQLVEVALAELRRIDRRGPPGDGRICVDLGTGSGAIALSLAAEGVRTDARLEVWATDRSSDALAVARANLSALSAALSAGFSAGHAAKGEARAGVRLVAGRWFEALPSALAGSVDLIVSNPPYVADEEFEVLDISVRDWEPPEALRSAVGSEGTPGLADIEEIVVNAPQWLRDAGALVVEIAPDQAEAAAAVARQAGFGDVTTGRDLAGRVRMLVARRT